MKRYLCIMLLSLLITISGASTVSAVELDRPVDYWVPGDYESIQDAIDNAPTGSVIGLSRDIETVSSTINFHRPMVIQGHGTVGYTTIKLANQFGSYEYVFYITADHCGLQDLKIEEAHYDITAGIKIEANNCAVNEIIMDGFDEHGVWAAYAQDLDVSYCFFNLTGSISDGIILYESPRAHIVGNKILSKLSKGISIDFSDDVVIENNNITMCEEDGIDAYFSHNLEIYNNDLTANGGGLTLNWCYDANVYNNLFDLNSDHGVSIWQGASYNHIHDNIITNTYGTDGSIEWGDAVRIDKYDEPCENNTITRNTIENNYRSIRVDLSDQNYAYLNNIIDNIDQTTGWTGNFQSPTELEYKYNGNIYTGYLGNYWSDYSGVDVSPIDGVGDTVYEDISSNIWDSYPLIAQESNYILQGEAPPETEFNLTLSTGWNLISLPVAPQDNHTDAVFGSLGYYRIYAWNGTDYEIPNTVKPGTGYWLLVLNPASVTVTGTNVEILELTLPAGWSLIGGTANLEAADGFDQVYGYNGTGYIPATGFTPGKGFWILLLSGATVNIPLI